MKKRLLHGFGMAFLLASPLWITMQKRSNYFNFAFSLIIGILLLILAWQTNPRARTNSCTPLQIVAASNRQESLSVSSANDGGGTQRAIEPHAFCLRDPSSREKVRRRRLRDGAFCGASILRSLASTLPISSVDLAWKCGCLEQPPAADGEP